MNRQIALIALMLAAIACACGVSNKRNRVPPEVEDVVTTIGSNIDQERYEQIYLDSADVWKRDVTLEQSNDVFKTLRSKLGKVENRSLHTANEQENSGGVLKGHIFVLQYETRFERGTGMETFTLIEDNGRWLLARYLVNSTNLK
jgi:hypothetical protein